MAEGFRQAIITGNVAGTLDWMNNRRAWYEVYIMHHATEDDETPLKLAVESGSQEMLNHLILRGAPHCIRTREEDLVAVGTKYRHIHIVRFLLECGYSSMNPYDHKQPLEYAVTDGDYDMCEVLLKHGADPNIRAHSVQAHIFWLSKDLRTLDLMIEHGARVKHMWVGARTSPLFFARSYDVFNYFIENGCPKWIVDNDKRTFIYSVPIETGRRVLADNPAYAYVVDSKRYTPLHHAVMEDDAPRTRLFLEHGLDPDSVTKNAENAFDIAVGDHCRGAACVVTEAMRDVIAELIEWNVSIEDKYFTGERDDESEYDEYDEYDEGSEDEEDAVFGRQVVKSLLESFMDEWTPERHLERHPRYCERIVTFLGLSQRVGCQVGRLPRELMFLVFSFVNVL